ncbi:MAG: hypothetical protein AAF394_04080 [Planctomycetota bacterium]
MMQRSRQEMASVRHRIEDILRPEPPPSVPLSRFWNIVLWTIVIVGGPVLAGAVLFYVVAGLAALVHGLAHLWDNPDPDGAQYFVNVVSALVMSLLMFVTAMPGFFTPMHRQRGKQLYMPVQYSQLIREWLQGIGMFRAVLCAIWSLVVVFTWIAGAPFEFLLIQTIWMMCLSLVASRLGLYYASRAGQFGALSTSVFFAAKVWLVVALCTIPAEVVFGAIFPAYWIAALPSLLADNFGALVGSSVAAGLSIVVLVDAWRQQGLVGMFAGLVQLRPSKRTLWRLSRRWRDLPDKEDLHGPPRYYWRENRVQAAKESTEAAGSSPQATVEAAIVASMNLHPKRFVSTSQWWKVRIVSMFMLLFCIALFTFISAVHWELGTPSNFGYPLLFNLAPTAWALAIAGHFIQYGIVDSGGLLQSAKRTLIFDTVVASLLCLPPVLGLCVQQGRYVPLIPYVVSVAITVPVGVVWPLLVRAQADSVSLFAGFVFFLPCMFVGILLSKIVAMLIPGLSEDDVDVFAFASAFVGSSLPLVFGWDRIAMWARPRLEKFLAWIRPVWPL